MKFSDSTQNCKKYQKGLRFHWKNKAYFTCGTLEPKSAKIDERCRIWGKSEKMMKCAEFGENVRKVRNLGKSAKMRKV